MKKTGKIVTCSQAASTEYRLLPVDNGVNV